MLQTSRDTADDAEQRPPTDNGPPPADVAITATTADSECPSLAPSAVVQSADDESLEVLTTEDTDSAEPTSSLPTTPNAGNSGAADPTLSASTPERPSDGGDLLMAVLASDGDDEIVDDSDGDMNDNVSFDYDDFRDFHHPDNSQGDASDASQTNETSEAGDHIAWVQLAARSHNVSFDTVRLPSLSALMMRRQSTTGTHAGRPIQLDEDPSPPPTTTEIDLTADSDDDPVVETGRRDPNVAVASVDEDDEDDVEIVGTTTAPNASNTTNRDSNQNAAVPPPMLSRKRRRRPAGGGSSRNGEDTGQQAGNKRHLPDVHSAESTNISMENNEVLERFKQSLKCSICLDVLQDMSSTICGHIYCAKCIRLAIHMTHKCPLCQRPLRPKDMHPLFF
ncbi:hypothetical protein PINS_up010532 [Pythium insidiosum]|nr:hypothetical protein PINS_up010532 [Pythium insidiosum]